VDASGKHAREEQLSDEELARETGQPLPDRAALSTCRPMWQSL